MKRIGVISSLVAILSLAFLQVTPSYAAPRTETSIIGQAQAGQIAVLTQAQMQRLAATNPALYNKLLTAAQHQAVPQLTRAERSFVRHLTETNLSRIKAGQTTEKQRVDVQVPTKAPDLSSALTACVTAGTSALLFLGPFAPVVAIIGCLLIIPLIGAALGLQKAEN